MLRKIRITLATLMFLGITLLFLDFTGTLHHWLAWMAEIQFLPAILALNVVITIVLVVLTLVFGRIYCSIICPLGVMQDIFGWIGKKTKHNRYTYSHEVKWLRYPMLVIYVAACVAGIGSLMALLEPYSAYGRIATMLFQPLYLFGNNALAAIAERYDSYAFYSVEVWMRSLPTLIIASVTFVGIAFISTITAVLWPMRLALPLGKGCLPAAISFPARQRSSSPWARERVPRRRSMSI